ncbi:MAG: hypothetical protein JW838_15830 [Spirochaetes bacterium]|nr:hypothetical protein [Spirochaetota bacterium]
MKNREMPGARLLIMALAMVAAGALVSCGSDGGGENGIMRNGVTFYSAASPGPWTEQAADHDPEISITRTGDRKTINVTVPFTQRKEKDHFLEAIIILDLNGRELKKVSFERGRDHRGARFDFPEEYTAPVYVVIKCNKHDMWEKLVDWSE